MSALNCPVCPGQTLAEASPRAGLTVDHCSSCGGAWLDIGEVYAFIRDGKAAQAALKSAYGRPMPSARVCPRCARAMRAVRLDASGVLIEACPGCGGNWFDKGELAAFAGSLSPAAQKPPAAAPKAEAHGGSQDLVQGPDPDAPRPTPLSDEEAARFAGPNISAFVAGAVVVCGLAAVGVLHYARGVFPELGLETSRPFLLISAAVLLTAVPAARAASARSRRLRGAWRVAGLVAARQEQGGLRADLVVRYAFGGGLRGVSLTVDAGGSFDAKVGERLWLGVRPHTPEEAVPIPPP